VTEQAAKLTVKVKLHAAQPVVLPSKATPARLSKLKVCLGLLLMVLLTAASYLLLQQFVGKVPEAVAAESQPANDVAVALTHDVAASAVPEEIPSIHPTASLTPTASEDVIVLPDASSDTALPSTATAQQPTPTPANVVQTVVTNHTLAQQVVVAETENLTSPQTNANPTIPKAGRNLPEGFSRIVLAATMEQLEPGTAIDNLVAQQQIQRLYLFTELRGYAGQQLIHRWSFAGQVQTEALLMIEDSPWRTYSENWLLPDQLGRWRVEIVDQQQNVLYQHDFQYQ